MTTIPISTSANQATTTNIPQTSTDPTPASPAKTNSLQPNFAIYTEDLLYATMQEEENLPDHNKFILVDVRPEKDFHLCHIPDSLNIPLHELKHKPFLKQKNLVLINSGGNYAALEQTCQKLIKYGFRQTAVLVGGLTAWRDGGGKLVGDHFTIENIDELTPADYFADRLYDDWLVVRIIKEGEKVNEAIFTDAVTLSNNNSFNGSLAREIHAANQDSPFLFTLLVNDDGTYDTIKKKLRKAGINNIFYLHGGARGYATFLTNNRLTNSSLKSKPTSHKVKRCRRCP